MNLKKLRVTENHYIVKELPLPTNFEITFEADDGLRYGEVVLVPQENKLGLKAGQKIWYFPIRRIPFYYDKEVYVIVPFDAVIVIEE